MEINIIYLQVKIIITDMVRELRTLIITEERHPNEQDVMDAWDYANQKHCYVELKWFVEHIGWKTWFIDPEKHTIGEMIQNLHIMKP